VDARSLNRRVTIKAPPTAQDDDGQPTGDWQTFCSPWANVRYLNGSESIKAGADTSTAKASIRIRYRTGLNSGMRVELGSTVYQIKAVLPDEQGKDYVDLVCEVIV
jgi:SPP1 family predicted phage head-tail adaptor